MQRELMRLQLSTIPGMQYQWESSEIPIYYDGTSSMPLTMEDPKPQSSDYIGLPQSLKIVGDFGQDRSIVPLFLLCLIQGVFTAAGPPARVNRTVIE